MGERQLEPHGSPVAGAAGRSPTSTSTTSWNARRCGRSDRARAASYDCDDFKRAQIPIPKHYVHPDHIDVGAAVPDMGNHLIDAKSPELVTKGTVFTHTFIFGAYDGHVSFYEPMITRAYLESHSTCACRSSNHRHGKSKATIRPNTASGIWPRMRYTVSLEFVHRPAGEAARLYGAPAQSPGGYYGSR